jgi:hypothetical protein
MNVPACRGRLSGISGLGLIVMRLERHQPRVPFVLLFRVEDLRPQYASTATSSMFAKLRLSAAAASWSAAFTSGLTRTVRTDVFLDDEGTSCTAVMLGYAV